MGLCPREVLSTGPFRCGVFKSLAGVLQMYLNCIDLNCARIEGLRWIHMIMQQNLQKRTNLLALSSLYREVKLVLSFNVIAPKKEGEGKRRRRREKRKIGSRETCQNKRETCSQLGVLTVWKESGILNLWLGFLLCERDSPTSEEKPHSCRHGLSRGKCLGDTCSVQLVWQKHKRKNLTKSKTTYEWTSLSNPFLKSQELFPENWIQTSIYHPWHPAWWGWGLPPDGFQTWLG